MPAIDNVPPPAVPVWPEAGGRGGDVASTLAWRRSLRASRVRRATAALRRRRLLRGRRAALVAAAGVLLASAGAGAVATQRASPPAPSAAAGSATIAAAQRALGVADDGVAGPRTRRATKRFQRAHGLVADGIIGPRTLAALGVTVAETRTGTGGGAAASPAAGSLLDRIAACESGGDPAAVSANGLHRGKYQFTMATWRAMGGRGDPARAPEAEQDARAAKLLAAAGTRPWPSCA